MLVVVLVIQFNILVESNGKAIIGEMQFLLKFFLKAKSMGHSLYGIVRRREFIDDVVNMIEFSKLKSNFKMTMNDCILKHNYSQLCNEILINNDSLLFEYDNYNDSNSKSSNKKPFLYLLMENDWEKGSKLFYTAVLHFDRTHSLAKKYIRHYLRNKSFKKLQNDNKKQQRKSIEILTKSRYFSTFA